LIRSLPSGKTYRYGYIAYVSAFYLFLFSPLLVTCILAFNDSNFPGLPWEGFTLDWFLANEEHRTGVFHDERNLNAVWVSLQTAGAVAFLSLIIGSMAAFLFEQEQFRFKQPLFFLALTPLVIPGVILGISLLLASNSAGLFFEEKIGIDLEILRPSFGLVVLGQMSFISTFVMLVVSARLKKFDTSLEEAALNLGATRLEVIRYITIPYLKPALIGAGSVAFLMSFENFNTTLFLIGSDTTLPISLYLQVRDGSTPLINAISFVLIISTSILALINLIVSRKRVD